MNTAEQTFPQEPSSQGVEAEFTQPGIPQAPTSKSDAADLADLRLARKNLSLKVRQLLHICVRSHKNLYLNVVQQTSQLTNLVIHLITSSLSSL